MHEFKYIPPFFFFSPKEKHPWMEATVLFIYEEMFGLIFCISSLEAKQTHPVIHIPHFPVKTYNTMIENRQIVHTGKGPAMSGVIIWVLRRLHEHLCHKWQLGYFSYGSFSQLKFVAVLSPFSLSFLFRFIMSWKSKYVRVWFLWYFSPFGSQNKTL